MRLVIPVAFALLVAAVSVAPPAAAGPCDNPIEELVCDAIAIVEGNVQAVQDSIRHLCDHWQICLGGVGAALP